MAYLKSVLSKIILEHPRNNISLTEIEHAKAIIGHVCIISFIIFIFALVFSVASNNRIIPSLVTPVLKVITIIAMISTVVTGILYSNKMKAINNYKETSVEIATEFQKQINIKDGDNSDYSVKKKRFIKNNNETDMFYITDNTNEQDLIQFNVKTGDIKDISIPGSILLMEYERLAKEIEKNPGIQSVQVSIDEDNENKSINIPKITYFLDKKIYNIVYEKEEITIKVE